MIIRSTIGMKGFLRLQCINKYSGKITQDTGWFPNTILNSGRNVMATEANWLTSCQVGTDDTAPNQSDTALLGYYAGTTDIVSDTNGTQSTPPYYGWRRKTFRFAAGTVDTILKEAGVGWDTSGSTLISRALLLDPDLQTPTTITPLADELLDVSYELRYYPPLIDVTTPDVTLDGIVYNTITRAATVTSSLWSERIGTKIGEYSFGAGAWPAYDGDIGTILTGPNGVNAASAGESHWNSAYLNNSYEIKVNIFCGALGWILGSGIRSISIATTAGGYQTQFNAAVGGARIPKTIAYSMTMSWIINWTEKV